MATLQAVELGVLGPLEVRQDGALVTIPGAKPRAILTMLGLHGGSVVSADTLVELLWSEDPPRTAVKALQTHISSLRRTLGDGFIVTQGAGWTVAGAEIDALRYRSAARLGRDAAATGDTSKAVAAFEEALALWRGLPELPDSRRGTAEKTRWIEGHAALVEDRADALLATGRAAEIIGELESAVADAPLRERRWAQLMLALYRAGRQGEALGAYQRARTLLAEELGVDPGPELRRLEAAIVAQDSGLEVPAAQNLSSVVRAVTFLLTDIEGSTAAWEADAAAMAVALARHDELVEHVVTSRGGRLIKTRGEGDATFSVFERPSAAAAAAVELQEAIAYEPWALTPTMRVRVALHTGEAEFRDGDYFGRAVNRAARLRSLAEGGQIVCSGATAELVIDSLSDDVLLVDLGTRQLRNLARPEHVFELRLVSADERHDPAESDSPMERPSLPAVLAGPGPFVGRGIELQHLSTAWQTTLAGATNAVLIAGEPGVGKTRLAGEWSRQAYDQGAVVLYGRCDEDLGAPYQPFAEALRSLVPCIGPSRLRGLRGVEALLPLVPGLTELLPDLAAPTRADPDTERYALFDAVVALVGLASASAPLVLILDDLQWAAKPTLLLLRHLLRFGEHARVQIVGTYRSTDLDRSHPLAAMLADLHRDGTAHRLSLGGLDEDEVSAYVAEAGYDDEELGRALASVTGGNPFFLIEALRHVDESGGHWDQSTLPQGVREAVSRRLSRLAPETNKALGAAAVVGSRFALELVERVVGDDLVDAFDEACKAGIVIEEPEGRYRFNHALVRQSLLAELPSVRRMRLHQRIATTLESEPGDHDELLAELAHHYFECAWAGNAGKAVEYCRRAADQAMARLAYEGAADLYDRAVHALEEIDDELPDRADQTAELLIARCEALLAAGDVTSAAGAVAQLQTVTVNSDRLAAWAACFDGQLSMLTHPERLDEVEAALGLAASRLAELDDAAGEAKAHTVRAGCLARLGRIGDCEIALDDALTAARRAREHRRVNAVLANAPLAALWGPSPVPRAGGRCLDVVRLLRITTDSPAVEVTSTRCQAVLEAFRGRDGAARRMIDAARRMVTESGLRHALLEVEQFAGIVELVAGDPASAEPCLRKACSGFRRMGLDADVAETAALLGRACLALDRDAEAAELCSESERLAGNALKASIAWSTLRAQLLSRAGDHTEARRVAEAAVALAGRTDGLVDHGDACLALAVVLGAAGDAAGQCAAAERALSLYELKGATALAEKARRVLGAAHTRSAEHSNEAPVNQPDNECVRVVRQIDDAYDRDDWEEIERHVAAVISVASHRKVVGNSRQEIQYSQWESQARDFRKILAAVRYRHEVVAVRGDRLALTHLEVGTADVSPGAARDELLQLYGLDEEGRLALQVWFDVEDLDDAMTELETTYQRLERQRPQARTRSAQQPANAASKAAERFLAHLASQQWDAMAGLLADDFCGDDRRPVVGSGLRSGRDDQIADLKAIAELWSADATSTVIATRGSRLALLRLQFLGGEPGPQAFVTEVLSVVETNSDGQTAAFIVFGPDDLDAAYTELDARHVSPGNRVSRTSERYLERVVAQDWETIAEMLAADYVTDDRRRLVGGGIHGRDTEIASVRAQADLGVTDVTQTVIAVRGERLALCRLCYAGRSQGLETFLAEMLVVFDMDADGRLQATVTFELEDFESAITELDARYLAGEAASHARVWSAVARVFAALNRREIPPATHGFVDVDHRRLAAIGRGDLKAYLTASFDDTVHVRFHVDTVHKLTDVGAVVTHVVSGTSRSGFDVDWRITGVYTFEGDLVSRYEVFEDSDLEAALARFDELSRTTTRLENTATQVYARSLSYFATRNWDALAAHVSDDYVGIDRRRVVKGENQHGRDAVITELKAGAEVGFTISMVRALAIRGTRLVLARVRGTGLDADTVQNDVLNLVETDADGRVMSSVMYDLEDFEPAITELDARYLAGEAAPYASTWSVVAGSYAAIGRNEFPAMAIDAVTIDHRRERPSFAPGELNDYISAGFELNHHVHPYVEVVHQLNDSGAVVTYAAKGISRDGFDAEWRDVTVSMVEGNLIGRCEFFDEADLELAIARFEELSRPQLRIATTASQAYERFQACFAARDWDAMSDLLAHNLVHDGRRRVVGSGVREGRAAFLAAMTALAGVGVTHVDAEIVATRGSKLILSRSRASGRDERPEAFHTDVLIVAEVDTAGKFAAWITLDPDELEVAYAELEARYLAGEAAPYGTTWSVIVADYVALNRRELPRTTRDWVNIDHRRGTAFGDGEMTAYIRASMELKHDVHICIETVHRLTAQGAVFTHTANGQSPDGFQAEWREIHLLMVDGGRISRCELFDEEDLDAALARFDELLTPTRQLENAAARASAQGMVYFVADDWAAGRAVMAEDFVSDDRRRVINTGMVVGRDTVEATLRAGSDVGFENITSTVMAIRGERLLIDRLQFSGRDSAPEPFISEMLRVVEIDEQQMISATVFFDPDDIDEAYAELDARYLAGEAGPYADTWSVIASTYASFDQGELPKDDWVMVDHRRATPVTFSTSTQSIRAKRDFVPELTIHIEAVHRLDDIGAVVTNTESGTSLDGLETAWRMIQVLVVEGDRISRCELFDELELGAALARFDELHRPPLLDD